MLIKFGAVVVGGRGKMGGTIFSHNRGGDYAKNNAIPVNPQSPFQMESRAALAQFSSNWNELTDEERATWNTQNINFQRNNVFGDAKTLSGKNLYVSLNRELLLTDQGLLDSAPAVNPPTMPTAAIKTEYVVAQTGSFELSNTAVGDQLVILATPPVSAGTSFVKNRLRVIDVIPAIAEDTVVTLDSVYEARFGAAALGQKFYVGGYAVSPTGQRSPQVTASVIVAAA